MESGVSSSCHPARRKRSLCCCALITMFLCLLIIGVWSITTATFSSFSDLIPEVPNPLNVVFSNKCLEDLGCFYTGPPFFHPLNRPISLTPTSELKTKFILFTPSNPQKEELLNCTSRSIESSSFDLKLPLKVLIHGYRSDLDVGDIRFELKDAFLNTSDYNIIIVDWTEHNGPPYPRAVANARAVGAQLSNLLKLIMKTTGFRAENIHIIGHSLGGQMAGWAGERIPNLGRITGLDPAGPYFQDGENEVRLDATDAMFVDVIHTDGGEHVVDGLGIGDPVGHMDFYPNGGRRQPGCFYTSESRNLLGSVVNNVFQNKCIENLDCFYTGPPFFHPIYRPISVPPSQNLSTQFLLYTPMNPNDSQMLMPTEDSLRTSTLDPNLETKILIHGFTVRLDPGDIRFKLKDELLSRSPMNVIIVNWTKDNQSPYPKAVANARAVGAQVAKLINYHVENMNMDPKSIHIIGHSLGAQMSGWIGERVPGLARITGLDPAGPWFQKAPPEVRLDTSDAEFVDIIHTNGGDIYIQGLGINEAIGHLDFYPNGGNDQPGCFYAALILTGGERNRNTDLIANSCDHSRANYIFLDSINKCQFVGVQCKNYKDFREKKCVPENSYVALMGYHATKLSIPTEGTSFYLQTTEQTPFCGESDEIV